MKKLFVIWLILFIGFFPICAGADLIDFESGYAEGNGVGNVNTATNTVSFYVSKNSSGGNAQSKMAAVGGATVYAFPSTYGNDTPSGTGAGSYFFTDTNGSSNAENYFIQFLSPVANISLDLYAFDSLRPRLNIKNGFNWAGKIEHFSKVSILQDLS